MLGLVLALFLAGADEIKTEEQWVNYPGLHADEQHMIDMVNKSRTARGLHKLKPDMHLVKGSRRHSYWMAKNYNLSHAPNQWENIAMGQNSVQEVHQCWMNSSGHYANIMSSNSTHIGCSIGRAKNGQFFWTQRFRQYAE